MTALDFNGKQKLRLRQGTQIMLLVNSTATLVNGSQGVDVDITSCFCGGQETPHCPAREP